jgi:hypothetical protein
MLIMLFSGTTLVSAEDNILYPPPGSIYLIALPVMGATVLLICALPALLGRRYWREPAAFHVANVLTVSSLAALIATLLILYSSTGMLGALSLVTMGVLALLVFTGIFVRYLLLPLPWATVAAGALAIIIFSLAYMAIETPPATIHWMAEGLLYSLPLWLLVWVGLLLLETAKYHIFGDESHEGPVGPGVPRRRRMLRLGELLIMNMVMAGSVPLFIILS